MPTLDEIRAAHSKAKEPEPVQPRKGDPCPNGCTWKVSHEAFIRPVELYFHKPEDGYGFEGIPEDGALRCWKCRAVFPVQPSSSRVA